MPTTSLDRARPLPECRGDGPRAGGRAGRGAVGPVGTSGPARTSIPVGASGPAAISQAASPAKVTTPRPTRRHGPATTGTANFCALDSGFSFFSTGTTALPSKGSSRRSAGTIARCPPDGTSPVRRDGHGLTGAGTDPARSETGLAGAGIGLAGVGSRPDVAEHDGIVANCDSPSPDEELRLQISNDPFQISVLNPIGERVGPFRGLPSPVPLHSATSSEVSAIAPRCALNSIGNNVLRSVPASWHMPCMLLRRTIAGHTRAGGQAERSDRRERTERGWSRTMHSSRRGRPSPTRHAGGTGPGPGTDFKHGHGRRPTPWAARTHRGQGPHHGHRPTP